MATLTQDLVDTVQRRTHDSDPTRVIRELNRAKNWAYDRMYNSAVGADTLISYDNEYTLTAYSRQVDVGAVILASNGSTVYGIKNMWLKFTNDTNFTPMKEVDSGQWQFVQGDIYPASDTTTVATGHPVYYHCINFNQIRVSPPLPSGAKLRFDYWRRPPDLDPTTNNTIAFGDDVPMPVLDAIEDKATAVIFSLLDDDRAAEWDALASSKLRDALYLIQRRSQTPTETGRFRSRRRNWI